MAGLSLRRSRLNRHLRELTREIRVHREQLIQPLFIVDGIQRPEPVDGIQSVYRDTPESVLPQIEADLEAGIKKFLLFGVPGRKQERDFDHRFTSLQIAAIKEQFGEDLWLAADVCLCSHTTHGHCGMLNDAGDYVRNDATVAELARAALSYASAGADCVAPSDMMDGRVAAIRAVLDQNDLERTAVMSYAAKFQSHFYGPFRAAANSAPAAGNRLSDRASYQLDPARPTDALRSARRDAAEGADILMVKPGLPYLDVLAELTAAVELPWAVYQVSGEQAAIDMLAERGLADRDAAQRESWTAFVRAGANAIISYAARRAVV
ncbi:MAG: porphobilinogen synthase [Gammaproteobacteria bacterium]|nr:porphobilinogen synthase [Gammaproteobacteria bacterium]